MTEPLAAPAARRRLPRQWIVAAGAGALVGAGIGAAVAVTFTAGPSELAAGRAETTRSQAASTAASGTRDASAASAASARDCTDAGSRVAAHGAARTSAAEPEAAAAVPRAAAARAEPAGDRLRQRLEKVLGAKGRVEPDRDGGLRFVAAGASMVQPRAGAAVGGTPAPVGETGADQPPGASGTVPATRE